jgi:hypothetical protein
MAKYGFSRCNNNPYFTDVYEKNQLISIYKNDNTQSEIVKDVISSYAICEYLEKNKKWKLQQDNSIKDIIEKEEGIIIFGTGSYTMQLLKEYPKLKEKVLFFVDNNSNKQGTILCEKEIKSAEALREISSEILILVCSMKNSGDIEAQLKMLTIPNRVVSLIERSKR